MLNVFSHESEWNLGESAVALGTFDGVHLGHRKLIETASAQAGLISTVFTFSNHPLSVITPARVPVQLDTLEEKLADIEDCGAAAAVLRPFDRAFAGLEPEEFVGCLAAALHPRFFVVGFNYTFGAMGRGKAEDLVRLGRTQGIETLVVDRVEIDGETVSSSRIRAALTEGETDLARRMLGRPYRISGKVENGKHLGRTLGFPTANLAFPEGKLLPRLGVYGCLAHTHAGIYPAAVNVGTHPTAPGGPPTIEAFLLDYPGDVLYGETLLLEFWFFIRPEKQFDSLEALREEVLRNCRQVKEKLGADAAARK